MNTKFPFNVTASLWIGLEDFDPISIPVEIEAMIHPGEARTFAHEGTPESIEILSVTLPHSSRDILGRDILLFLDRNGQSFLRKVATRLVEEALEESLEEISDDEGGNQNDV